MIKSDIFNLWLKVIFCYRKVILFAPQTVMSFYHDFPARENITAVRQSHSPKANITYRRLVNITVLRRNAVDIAGEHSRFAHVLKTK